MPRNMSFHWRRSHSWDIRRRTEGHSPKRHAIHEYTKPQIVVQLCRFLGIANYYRRCLRNAAQRQAVFNNYLKNSRKNDKQLIRWIPKAEHALDNIKKDLANAALLAHPAEALPLHLITDSKTAIGVTLEQNINSNVQSIGFFSRKLSPMQTRYSAMIVNCLPSTKLYTIFITW